MTTFESPKLGIVQYVWFTVCKWWHWAMLEYTPIALGTILIITLPHQLQVFSCRSFRKMRTESMQKSRKSSVPARNARPEIQILFGIREQQLPGIHNGKVISNLSSVSMSFFTDTHTHTRAQIAKLTRLGTIFIRLRLTNVKLSGGDKNIFWHQLAICSYHVLILGIISLSFLYETLYHFVCWIRL